ncbi:hypothetical protein THIOM_004961 [Candidatus Thiomargarita nelsonii]|uniref:Uncharacterized protein n=1 Tax=Candidatus Thiomargarita nelsonii TaxID=1003181 RepID=A0A176RUK9_9GAMM|nr:hypothetical protein THIOM_004961 [Candidatus Thiomargarita nelsonii]
MGSILVMRMKLMGFCSSSSSGSQVLKVSKLLMTGIRLLICSSLSRLPQSGIAVPFSPFLMVLNKSSSRGGNSPGEVLYLKVPMVKSRGFG